MNRLAAVTFAGALAAAPVTADAADMTELNVLGFSADGKIFAFEEFGVHDGSGYPFANRFYIDIDSDRFVPGTPIRIRVEEDGLTADAAREQARARGEAIVSDRELAANRGLLSAFNPPTELSADPHRIVIENRPLFPSTLRELEFRLEEFPVPDNPACLHFGDGAGFRLLRIDAEPGAQIKLLHEDKSLPASRNCAYRYRLGGVQTFYDDGPGAFAVLITVVSHGYEGPDHFWMAVTGRFSAMR